MDNPKPLAKVKPEAEVKELKPVGIFDVIAAELRVPIFEGISQKDLEEHVSYAKILELQNIGCTRNQNNVIISSPGTKANFKLTVWSNNAVYLTVDKDYSEDKNVSALANIDFSIAKEDIFVEAMVEDKKKNIIIYPEIIERKERGFQDPFFVEGIHCHVRIFLGKKEDKDDVSKRFDIRVIDFGYMDASNCLKLMKLVNKI